MQITPNTLQAIFYAFDLEYQKAFDQTEIWSQNVAGRIPSSTASMRYAWLAMINRMREWIGPRFAQNLRAREYELVNRRFENTIKVDVDVIEDDQIGIYSMDVQMLGNASKKWPDQLVQEAMQKGNVNLCYDGQPFFSSSHPVDIDDGSKGAYSNQALSTALSVESYRAARSAMRSIKGEDGYPLRVTPKLLVVPPALELVGKQILEATYVAPTVASGGNAANVMQENLEKGTAQLLVVDDFAGDDTTAYLLDTTKPMKPFVFQERKSPVLTPVVDPASHTVFQNNEYMYGVKSRGAAGYSLPFLAYRITGLAS